MDLINNTKTISNSTTEDDLSDIDVAQIAGKGLFFLFAMIGLMSNIALIRIYKRKDSSLRFNNLMLILAMFDLATITLFLVTGIIQFSIGNSMPVFNAILLYVDVSVAVCSGYTMIAVALDRYLIFCKDRCVFLYFSLCMVFENHRKSLIQQCERSELL